jgi:Fe-S-cluster containining protein
VAFTLSRHPGVAIMGGGDAIHHPPIALEIFTVAGMVEPLTLEETIARLARFGVMKPPVEGIQHYKCRHWDEETRLCKIYDRRPYMCRDYPGYGEAAACEYGCDCQMPAIPGLLDVIEGTACL